MVYCDKCFVDSSRNEYLQCHYCKNWTHSICNGLSASDVKSWNLTYLKFVCKSCAYDDGTYDVNAALVRLTIVRLTGRRKALANQAQSELKLLDTYNIRKPRNSSEQLHSLCDIDHIATSIINMFEPTLINEYSPLKTVGDGNCLYRAVSLAMTGSQEYHPLLRLLTALELILNPDSYDTKKKDNNFLNDIRIVTSAYDKLVSDAIQESSYSEMGHIYALSAALAIPIRSHFPSKNKNELSNAFSRVVKGRSVSDTASPISVMWSSASLPIKENIEINHFVPLVDRRFVANIDISLGETECESSEFMTDNVRTESRADETYTINCDVISESEIDNENVELDALSTYSVTHDVSSVFEIDNAIVESDTSVVHDISSVSSVSDDDSKTLTDDVVNDETTGHLVNGFLTTDRIIELLTSGMTCKETIPVGVKDNVYYVIDNTKNANSKMTGKHSDFSDDCGIWDTSKGTSPKTYYVKFGNSFRQTYLRDNMFCYRKKTKGQIDYIPYDPQPDASIIFHVQRYYAISKKDKTYKRRVSWLANSGHHSKLAVVEYAGHFPGLTPHGNSTTGEDYTRVPTNVMDEITELTGKLKPHQIMNKLTDKYDIFCQPSSLRQVHDKQYRDRQKYCNVDGHKDNFADQLRHIENLITNNNPFVRSVLRTSGRTPSIILYTDEQINDIKTICCTGKTVLGLDKTFMLCKMHVTVSCYKQLTVVNPRTGHNPIFLGPIFIHDNSDFETFNHFLCQLKCKLHDVPHNKLVIGSDDEKALVKAIETVFHQATHVLCTRHLEENVRHKLTVDAVTKDQKQYVLSRIFGPGGLLDANDSLSYDYMANDIDNELAGVSLKFRQYFNRRLVTILKTKVNDPQRENKVIKKWTNNNCESMNHVLKQTVDWKSQSIPDLVTLLHDLVKGQFNKLRSALVQTGDYRLASSHILFQKTKTEWIRLTEKQRSNHYRRYRQFVPTDAKMVTSTDGKSTDIAPKTNGRKPGQVKRKPKTLTLTHKLKTRKTDE